ncbi:prepilin-type N-terminal cleavage/methylation domain-containing protein [Stutzerimonas stutzeri]|uniref:prepilin-type N-terminal cleavage/methylation domain-containing protein n=1 Tax=Stutzerimonas stutzeri TaxID=316 RepID=UPI0021091F1A|nr:prepilin-type N-terminal cleavage/methylation domain-containing protein [Stutzerimonas stutzeri]
MRCRQRGMTLIELSVVLVVLGLMTAVLMSLLPSLTRLASVESAIDDVNDTQNAITGFALATGRLPCADTNQDGVEDCPAVAGGFPYLTVGLGGPLRNAHGYDYRYAVYVRSDGAPMNDVNLVRATDRWQPILVSGLPPAAALEAFDSSTPLDLCRALGVAQTSAADNQYLYLEHSGAREAVAYVLADPGQADRDGNGSLFDGLNAAGLGFEHPVRNSSREYDDRVSVVRFNQLWEQLGCSALLSTAGHAHPNVLSTLAMFRQTIRDYKTQLELVEEMAFADNFQTGASIASATASVAAAAASAPTATASAINTFGATAAAVGASLGAITGNAALVGLAGAAQAAAIINLNKVRDQLKELDLLIKELDELHDDVRINVVSADNDALSAQ